MPCSDQSEVLVIFLDGEEAVKSFNLYKLSCNKNVGIPALLKYIEGKKLSQIAEKSIEELIPDLKALPFGKRFLLEKQFWSVKTAAEVWTGQTSARQKNFTLESILYNPDEIEIRGQFSLKFDAEEISPCKSCCSRKN